MIRIDHTLKTAPAMFRAVRDERKNFDIRCDDRAFQTGDVIKLVYHDGLPNQAWGAPPACPTYLVPAFDKDDDIVTPLIRRITFVLRGGQYGIETGCVGLSLETVDLSELVK